VRDLVAWIRERLRGGDNVVVHCRGGLGRTGTIAACVLVARGVEPDEAMRLVRASRPGAIESEAQERFVRTFAITC